ncbi:MAG: ACP S-malonyltransferase, partial [Bdellovibrionales bacterium]|nr:ACP S-malonyltransferase [Bdellovibrionales bacterium]
MWASIYPGQGSQHSGMGKFLWENFRPAKEVFEEASEAIKLDLRRLCFEAPDSELALTHNTQPALLTVSVASFRVLESLVAYRPIAGAGHSIGEYAALVAAGSLDFSDAVKAVRQRGLFMQSAVPLGEGAMLALLGLGNEQVEELCLWVKKQSGYDNLDAANFNSPSQVVVSGSRQAIEWLQKNYSEAAFSHEKPRRVKLIPLKVSAPFHCAMMKPAEIQMRKVLEEIEFLDSSYPIVQNFTAEPSQKAKMLCENLIYQISAPVRWVECVEKIGQMGGKRMIELGSGKVLAGLVKKIDSTNFEVFGMNDLEDIRHLE